MSTDQTTDRRGMDHEQSPTDSLPSTYLSSHLNKTRAAPSGLNHNLINQSCAVQSASSGADTHLTLKRQHLLCEPSSIWMEQGREGVLLLFTQSCWWRQGMMFDSDSVKRIRFDGSIDRSISRSLTCFSFWRNQMQFTSFACNSKKLYEFDSWFYNPINIIILWKICANGY